MTFGGQSGNSFVSRDREMGELKAALEDALSGNGRLVMLAGESGIGKTRTCQELAAQAEALGARVLWGWCFEEPGGHLLIGPGSSPYAPTSKNKPLSNCTPRWAPVLPTSPRLSLRSTTIIGP